MHFKHAVGVPADLLTNMRFAPALHSAVVNIFFRSLRINRALRPVSNSDARFGKDVGAGKFLSGNISYQVNTP
jgi:hypothetical protein